MQGRDRPSPFLTSLLNRATVLVVDDGEAVRNVLRRALGSLGSVVLLARDGEEALGVLNTMAADLVLCDIAMPGMDGIELVRRLRGRPGVPEIAVLAMSSAPVAAELVARFGFDGFLTKPFGYGELTETLRQVVRNRPAWRERQHARLRRRAAEARRVAAAEQATAHVAQVRAEEVVGRAMKLTKPRPGRRPVPPRFRPELLWD